MSDLKTQPNPHETAATRRRYQRLSPFYDLLETLPEQVYQPWRERLWSMVAGKKVLEVGVGTGKNMPYYPEGADIAGIDLTSGMLERAQQRAEQLDLEVDLWVGDVQDLNIPDNTFDTVVSTCVFCSVPDPVLGLQEVKRVLKPGGRLLMIEHVRSEQPLVGEVMDLVNPVVRSVMGPNINRHTVDNVHKAGLRIEHVEELGFGDIFKLIVAHKHNH
jgi:ubiquinone/menaquinone biosynthesis C-methylase UbiE